MKRMMKRLSIALMMLVLVMGLTACSSKEEVEENGVSDSIVASLETSCGDILETLSILTDEEIDAFLASGDEFTIIATNSWLDNREEVGTFVEVKSTEVTFEKEEGKYHLSSDVAFTDKDATVSIHFDETGVPTYFTMEVQYSLGELMGQAGLNTVMGIGIVFLVLLFLSILIGLFKYIDILLGFFTKKNKKEEVPATPKAAPAPVALVEEELVDDKELVAVIAAAIAAYENTSTDSFVVRSIRRKPNNKWSRA